MAPRSTYADSIYADSLRSSSTSTFSTLYTTTSSSTIPGIGSTSGKVIRALGKTVLRGADYITIRATLSVLARHLPLRDSDAKNLDQKYVRKLFDDVLRLSRPDLYRSEFESKAMGLILTQIGTCEVKYLRDALVRWSRVELGLLLSRIITILEPLWRNPSGKIPSSVLTQVFVKDYCSAYPKWIQTVHRLRPILYLFGRVAQIGSSACEALLDAGFLNVLHFIYTNELHSARYWIGDPRAPGAEIHYAFMAEQSSALSMCNATLLLVTAYSEHRHVVVHHPVFLLWPNARTIMGEQALPYQGLKDGDGVLSEESLLVSLPEICRLQCISTLTPKQIFRLVSVDRVPVLAIIHVFLRRASREASTAFLRGLMTHFYERTGDQKSASPLFLSDPEDHKPLSFFLTISRILGDTYHQEFVGAGIVQFLTDVLHVNLPSQFKTWTLVSDRNLQPTTTNFNQPWLAYDENPGDLHENHDVIVYPMHKHWKFPFDTSLDASEETVHAL